MNHYLVELYTPNTAWKALSKEARQQFLSHIGTAMQGLSELGIEVLTLTETSSGMDQNTNHQFLGIWRFPTSQSRDALLAWIQSSGWYGYFDHVNAAGLKGDFNQHFKDLINF